MPDILSTLSYNGKPWSRLSSKDKERAMAEYALRLAAEAEARKREFEGPAADYWRSALSAEPGKLPSAIEAAYGSDLDKISQTYENLRSRGLKSLATRGFNRAPSGMQASLMNSANEAQGADETAAYRTALENAEMMRMQGAQGLQSLANGTESPLAGLGMAYNIGSPKKNPTNIGAGIAGAASTLKDLYGLFNKAPSGIIKNWWG